MSVLEAFSHSVFYPLWEMSAILNSLLNNKILHMIKLKAFEDDKITVAQMMISVFHRVENIVGKGENAGNQHFLLFQSMFSKGFFLGVVRSRDCVVQSYL